jgi:hypothetical protein
MKVGAGLVGILLCTTTLGAGERMTVKVSPAVAFAPANLIVRTMIEADADNRAIAIVAESADFYRSSEIQLDGDHAPRTNTVEFRSLPSGTYQVKAMLIGTGAEPRAMIRRQINVIANGAGR